MSAVSHDPETCPSAPRDRDKLSFFGPPAQSGLCHTQMYKGLKDEKTANAGGGGEGGNPG